MDDFDRWSGDVWALLQERHHLDCGGWTFSPSDPYAVTCGCGERVRLDIS